TPRQDPSREVVDHRVQVGAGSVEQTDDGGVDMPHLVGSRRSKANLGLGRVHAETWTAPAELPYQAVPRRRRCPNLFASLWQGGERPGRNVPVLDRGRHALDRLDFGWRESMR